MGTKVPMAHETLAEIKAMVTETAVMVKRIMDAVAPSAPKASFVKKAEDNQA